MLLSSDCPILAWRMDSSGWPIQPSSFPGRYGLGNEGLLTTLVARVGLYGDRLLGGFGDLSKTPGLRDRELGNL